MSDDFQFDESELHPEYGHQEQPRLLDRLTDFIEAVLESSDGREENK